MPDTGHKKLESREHILLRPNMYIGAIDHQTFSDYVDGKLTELKYIPGLVKIINEIGTALDKKYKEIKEFDFKRISKISSNYSIIFIRSVMRRKKV